MFINSASFGQQEDVQENKVMYIGFADVRKKTKP